MRPDNKYRLLGVRLEGNGAFHRETVSGTETSASRLTRVEAGDFIYSRLFAWRGAFGIIPKELDGAFVSNEFPLFRVDNSRLDSSFLNRWFQLPATWKRVEEDCTGSTPTTRNRFKEEFFLKLEIPLPPLSEQHAIVAKLAELSDKTRQLNTHIDAIEADADRLLALRFRDAIANAPYRPMSEVAPIEKRPVTLDTSKRYREVGARSFGKGLFSKPDFNAAEATWEKPVWIKSGDVVFSNIKAWEGAIALASDEHDNAIASHRYITCVPDSNQMLGNFLLYYLLSPEGLGKIGDASAGTADRNRTLSVTKLSKIEVPIPSLEAQRDFVTLQITITAIKMKRVGIHQANVALLPVMLEQIFG
ncbi:MAG: restriction endonuclease subunit S [Methylobacillus sp.]|nr:restriction endonuclease subunit S [Methylobacillus sp.]